jgi:chitinase
MVPIQTDSAPVAQINHPGPADGPRPANQPFPFSGVADDPEDGALGGAALVWTSDLEGMIGTGLSLDAALSVIGTHTITLTATDSDGNLGWDTVLVPIQ